MNEFSIFFALHNCVLICVGLHASDIELYDWNMMTNIQKSSWQELWILCIVSFFLYRKCLKVKVNFLYCCTYTFFLHVYFHQVTLSRMEWRPHRDILNPNPLVSWHSAVKMLTWCISLLRVDVTLRCLCAFLSKHTLGRFADMEWQTAAVSEKYQSRFGRRPGTSDSGDTGIGTSASDSMEGDDFW